MKKSIILSTITIIVFGLTLSSYEHGPGYEGGLNRTGSTGGATTCNGSGCHGPNATTTIVSVTVSSGGVPVTEYVPGTTYDVAIRGHNTATGVSSTEFGFQVSATFPRSSAQAGTFAVTSSKHRITSLGGIDIVEHKKANSDSATNYFVAKFLWTAPAAGGGPVKFYGILNSLDGGVDDDDDDDDGGSGSGKDYPNVAPIVTLSERGGNNSTLAVNYVNYINDVVLFPNPCANDLNIAMKGNYTICIRNAAGIAVYNKVVANEPVLNVPMSSMPAGIYHAEIMQDDGRTVKTFVKQ